MSVVPNFAYATTSFFVSVWIPLPGIIPWYHLGVFFVLALFQRIFLLANGVITDQIEFWWWQFLLTALGVILGVVFKVSTKGPLLIQAEHGWEASSLIKFPLTTVLYAGASAFYAVNPIPTSPWGLIWSILATTFVIVIVWVWVYDDRYITMNYNGMSLWSFFSLWMLANLILTNLFWISYTGLLEVWTAFIAVGSTIIIVIAIWSLRALFKGEPKRVYGLK